MADYNKLLDENRLAQLWALIKGKFVQAETGKGLSTNDFTTDEKNKLSNIEAGANENIIEGIAVNNVDITPVNKRVNLVVPTKVSDLTNDEKFQTDTEVASAIAGSGYQANVIETVKVNGSILDVDSKKSVNVIVPTDNSVLANGAGYQTASDVLSALTNSGYQANVIETVKVNNVALVPSSKTVNITVPTDNSVLTNGAGYQTAKDVTDAINEAIGGLTGISFEVVETLPTRGKTGVIYLVAHSHGAGDNYDEYVWLEKSESYEKIGNTDVDLSNYVTKNDITIMTEQELADICV